MFKLLLFLVGLAGGAAGATSWLLSEPGAGSTASTAGEQPAAGDSLEARVQRVKLRVGEALQEGAQAQAQTEQRLRRELDAYRKGTRNTTAR